MLSFTRRLLILFGAQYIYLGTTSGNLRLLKIGISKKTKRREREIDDSIQDSKERLTMEAVTFCAGRIEKALHRIFKNRRRPYKGSGRTEYFKLGFLTRLFLCLLLLSLEVASIVLFTSIILFLVIIVMNY